VTNFAERGVDIVAMKAKNYNYVTVKTANSRKSKGGGLQAKYCSAQIGATH
jgi:hypothetical protein